MARQLKMRIRIFSWIGILWGTFILLTAGPRIIKAEVGEGAYAAGQYFALAVGALMLFAGVWTLRRPSLGDEAPEVNDFARRYAKAWSSQNAWRVADFFSPQGSLTINGGTPSVGRKAITEAAQSFMTAFPDMVVTCDRFERDGGLARFDWTLVGTNTGPGGAGRPVRISGYEEWLFGDDGLVLDSQGHYDEADYQRQIAGAAGG